MVDAAGGLGGLTDRIVEIYGSEQAAKMLSFSPPSNAGEALMPFLVIVGLQWLFQMNSDGTGYLAQRSMACPTDREARIAGLVFTWLQIFLRSLFWLAIAIGLLVLYPFSPEEMNGDGFTAAREALFVTGIDELYRQCLALGAVHPNGPLTDQPWGSREFAVLDPDHNLITLYEQGNPL